MGPIAAALKAFKEMTNMVYYFFLGAAQIAMLIAQELNYKTGMSYLAW
jgi:hypothetical protein